MLIEMQIALLSGLLFAGLWFIIDQIVFWWKHRKDEKNIPWGGGWF